jgi:CubicO group peptidase (beta-lactamase class C family)
MRSFFLALSLIMLPILAAPASAEAQTSSATLTLRSGIPTPAMLDSARRYNEETGGQTMLVMIDGKIIAEYYVHGGGPLRPQPLASGSKSFVGVAAVAAVEDGLIRLEERASETLPEWRGDPRKAKVTLDQLLHLCSGLEPGESPLRTGAGIRTDWAQAIAAPMVAGPGERFTYGPNAFLVFGAVLQRKLKEKTGETFEAYLRRRVLEPLGVRVWWLRSPGGDIYLPGGALMTARDWAAFGELMRRDGRQGGKQIIAGKMLELCRAGSAANPAYGLTWWLKRPVPPRLELLDPVVRSELSGILHAAWLPDDFYMAAGAGKQRLYIIPSLKLVAVRQGPVRGGAQYRDTEFLKRLLVPDGARND